MPESADVILCDWFSNNACAIFDFIAQRARPELQQAKPERDQPTRGSTFDLQCLRIGFGMSRPPAVRARVGQADLIKNAPNDRINDGSNRTWPAIERGDRWQNNCSRLE